MNLEIWAIMNLAPNSFYSPSIISNNQITQYAYKYLEEGIDVLDIGAESTRPFSKPITHEEEWQRLKVPLHTLKKELGSELFSKVISIDTYKIDTIKKCLDLGVRIINHIKGGDTATFKLIQEAKATIVIMHSKGDPESMQLTPKYNDIISEILLYLQEKTLLAQQQGLPKKCIIWDVGIGFGKTLEHNIEILNNINKFQKLHPICMLGVSRKSFLGKILNIDSPEQLEHATTIIHTILALKNISILRVHDVQNTLQIKSILKYVQ